MESKRIGDFIVIGISVVLLLGVLGYASPLVISPFDNMTTTNASVLFSFDKADTILIDDNVEFSSPMELHAENNLVVNLKPGKYYWKIRGARESKVNTLTIVSEIDLRLREAGSQYELVNAGNNKLNVDIYNGSALTGNLILEKDESQNVTGTLFVGSENE
jgi:hypothetical protein